MLDREKSVLESFVQNNFVHAQFCTKKILSMKSLYQKIRHKENSVQRIAVLHHFLRLPSRESIPMRESRLGAGIGCNPESKSFFHKSGWILYRGRWRKCEDGAFHVPNVH